MRNFIFDGRLGRDAEVAETKGGKKYVRFSVANNTYRGGVESTDWIDVTSYDPIVIEKRAQYLKQGTYVIVTGDVLFDVTPKSDKVWKNIYVTATNIDTPSFGKKQEGTETSETTVVSQNAVQQPTTRTQTAYTSAPKVSIPTDFDAAYATATVSASPSDDVLPF